MAISDIEVESVRFHLGYGNIGLDASPYTSDGYLTLIRDVLIPNLSTGAQTTTSTGVLGGATATVTPAAMTGILVNSKIVADVGPDAEIVTVRSVTLTTFSAFFARAHTGSYPLALLSGEARLRLLLGQADAAWQALQDPSVGATAGLKQVDKGDVEWFQGFQVLEDREAHYRAIVSQIGSLLRVCPVVDSCGGAQTLSVY